MAHQAIRRRSTQVERIHRLRATAERRRGERNEYLQGFLLLVAFLACAFFAAVLFYGHEDAAADPESAAPMGVGVIETITSYPDRVEAATGAIR